MIDSLKKKDVALVFSGKRKFATPHFLIQWRANGLGSARVAFAFSRASGNAVARNRCKRRLRELVRREAVCAGLDLVVIARKPLGRMPPEVWQEEARRIIRCCEKTDKHTRPASA